MAVLMDILAYNTHYLAFNANMLANEMFIDSADTRKNLVSLAKMLNYTPKSCRPQATIDILLNNASVTSVTLDRAHHSLQQYPAIVISLLQMLISLLHL